MKKSKYLIILSILILSVFIVQSGFTYIPDNEIIINQTPSINKAEVNNSIEIALVIKNYRNFTLTNLSLSLNLTEEENLEFLSCDFGILHGENVTLNSTIQSSSELDFTPVNITEGYLTKHYLKLSVTRLVNGSKMLFRYNITANEEGQYQFPRLKLSYYDNWGDRKSIEPERTFQLEFTAIEKWPNNVPRWRGGKEIEIGWSILIYGLSPIIMALTIVSIFSYRRE